MSKEERKRIFNEKLDNDSANILSTIKIVPGKHTLICSVRYKYKHFWTISKEAKSEVDIQISNDLNYLYKNKQIIESFLRDLFINSFSEKPITVRHPEIKATFQKT